MRDPVDLLGRLEDAPASFDFHAALRLVECAHPDLPRIGTARRPRQEALRFGQAPSLSFEGASLARLERGGDGAPDEDAPLLLVNLFGLLGANGPMPVHVTEYVRDRLRNGGDPTLARFLDVFHHRMISLFYRAWASAQPAVDHDRPGADRFSTYVGALFGIGMPSLRERDAVPDAAKLHYAGRLAPHTASADGLAAILSDDLGVPVRVQQFVGHWMRLPQDGVWRLGEGAMGQLGQSTVLGRQVWNAQHKFRLLVGPVDAARLPDLLPDGAGTRRLAAWVAQYAGLALDWDVNLIVRKDARPSLTLGGGGRLGWTSWIGARAPAQDDRQLRFAPRRTVGPGH